MSLLSQITADIGYLAGTIGERHLLGRSKELHQAADWIAASLEESGLTVRRQIFNVDDQSVENIEATLPGAVEPDEILVLGAHYDRVPSSPGADDNASGIAVLLSVARQLRDYRPHRTIKLVAFANEEWPHFQTDTMGSYVYAKQCRASNEKIIGMIALDTIGFYSNSFGSQQVPPVQEASSLEPSARIGNFLAMVANPPSSDFLESTLVAFRQESTFPVVPLVLDEGVRGAGHSDHWSFWKTGFPAIMVTDTGPLRNPHYHDAGDLPSTISFPELCEVAVGISGAIRALALSL
jgi:Zn-dependent M28 family amino/carboxypeptidase